MSVSIGMPEWYTTESKTSYNDTGAIYMYNNNTSEGYPSQQSESYPSQHPEVYSSKQSEAYPSKQPVQKEAYPSKQPVQKEAYPSKQPVQKDAYSSKQPVQPQVYPSKRSEVYPSEHPDGFYYDTTAIYMYNHTLDIHTGAGLFKTCWKVVHLTACKAYQGDMLEGIN